MFCSENVLSDETKLSNINTSGCSGVIIDKASYGIGVLSGCCIGLSVLLAINVMLVYSLVMLITRERALYNAKYRSNSEYQKLEEAYIG